MTLALLVAHAVGRNVVPQVASRCLEAPPLAQPAPPVQQPPQRGYGDGYEPLGAAGHGARATRPSRLGWMGCGWRTWMGINRPNRLVA